MAHWRDVVAHWIRGGSLETRRLIGYEVAHWIRGGSLETWWALVAHWRLGGLLETWWLIGDMVAH